jgi:putative component of membrane protein insertase Oxa1/YidC/SpoIIIJ protein YidD
MQCFIGIHTRKLNCHPFFGKDYNAVPHATNVRHHQHIEYDYHQRHLEEHEHAMLQHVEFIQDLQ